MTATDSYQLGIDLGTTYTAAAVARDGRVEVAGLGNRATAIPSVIHEGADGATVVGEAADRRGAVEPDRVAREFKRRIGDPTPVLIGGSPRSAEALTAIVLRWVVDKVTELEGGSPAGLALTHPANWGPYKQDLLDQAARLAEVPVTATLTEPEAAAIAYAANERVEPGSLIAVYDLGGGTFDAAVLRKTSDGFDLLGEPEGIERLGGIDFDEAVIGHVRNALGDALDRLDLDDAATLAALTRLRRDCIDAKEALSSDTDVSIPVLLPGIQTDVRLTRVELEQMLRPTLLSTVDTMRRALAGADVAPADVAALLLTGGSSRIPLVAELLSDAFGRPIAVDAHPKHVIAQGAAIALAGGTGTPSDVPGPAAAGAAIMAGAAAPAEDGTDGTAPEPAGVAAASGRPPPRSHDVAVGAPATATVPEPRWALPVQHGGSNVRTRRLVGAGLAAIILVGVLVVGAAARSRTAGEPDATPSTGPTIEAVEVPRDVAPGRRDSRATGGASDGGGGATTPRSPAGGQPDTTGAPPAGADPPVSAEPSPPPTEQATQSPESEPPSTGDATDPPADPEPAVDPDAAADAPEPGDGTAGATSETAGAVAESDGGAGATTSDEAPAVDGPAGVDGTDPLAAR